MPLYPGSHVQAKEGGWSEHVPCLQGLSLHFTVSIIEQCFSNMQLFISFTLPTFYDFEVKLYCHAFSYYFKNLIKSARH